jgi:hypothetical protein
MKDDEIRVGQNKLLEDSAQFAGSRSEGSQEVSHTDFWWPNAFGKNPLISSTKIL